MFLLHQPGLGPDQGCFVEILLADGLFTNVREKLIQLPFGIAGITGGEQIINDDKVRLYAIWLQLNRTARLQRTGLELTLALEKTRLVQAADILDLFLAHFIVVVIAATGEGQRNGN